MSAHLMKVIFEKPRPVVCEVQTKQVDVVEGVPVYRMEAIRFTMALPIVWEWTDPDKTCECCGEHKFAQDHYFSLN